MYSGAGTIEHGSTRIGRIAKRKLPVLIELGIVRVVNDGDEVYNIVLSSSLALPHRFSANCFIFSLDFFPYILFIASK